MNFEILIPITLFICIVYAIKVVVDARVRKQMMDSNGSQELVRSMLEGGGSMWTSLTDIVDERLLVPDPWTVEWSSASARSDSSPCT